MTIEDDRRLVALVDTRTVGRLETMADELFEEFEEAVASYERGDGGG